MNELLIADLLATDLPARLDIIAEEASDEALETDDSGLLSQLLEDDLDSVLGLTVRFRDDHKAEEEVRVERAVQAIDKLLEEEKTRKSALSYSRQKQLQFDAVELEYQRMMLVGHSY